MREAECLQRQEEKQLEIRLKGIEASYQKKLKGLENEYCERKEQLLHELA